MPLSLCERAAAIAPSATLSIAAHAGRLRAQGYSVIDFSAGEPDFDTPEFICEAAVHAIQTGMTRYTAASGTGELRTAICEKLRRDNHLTYAPEDVVVSCGAKHALHNVCQALINPGDEVLLPAPCWVSYAEMIRLAGGVPVIIPGLPESDFIVTADRMRPFVTERTKALILNTPNNPNGCVWNEEQLRDIAYLAVEKGFYIISDEIYEKLIYDGEKHISIAALGEDIKAQTIVINGVSKSYAMTGWRIGYAAGPRPVMRIVSSYQSHTTSAPNTMAQHAAMIALQGGDACVRQMREEFDARRRLIVRLINETEGISCRMPKGAFYVMMNVRGLFGRLHSGEAIGSASDASRMLIESAHVAVVPGEAFCDAGHVRLSYATGSENIAEGMRRIRQFIAGLQ